MDLTTARRRSGEGEPMHVHLKLFGVGEQMIQDLCRVE